MSEQTALVATSNSVGQLSKRQKAAIIVRLLVGGGTSLESLDMDADTILKITQSMTGLGVVGRDVVDSVTAEFILAMEEVGLVFEGDLEGSLSQLSGQISDETLGLVKDRQNDSPEAIAWRVVARADSENLARLIAKESPQIGAVIISKLNAAKAAEIIGQIDGTAARGLLRAITKIANVNETVVARIGVAFAANIADSGDVYAFSDSAPERIGAILNLSQSTFREAMLDNIETDDPDSAALIRKLMFTFADIPDRITTRDISKVLRIVDDETLAMALAGAAETMPDVKLFILSNISSRLAEQIEENIKDNGPVKPRDADAAMTRMIMSVKELEKSGDIKLIEPEEEDA